MLYFWLLRTPGPLRSPPNKCASFFPKSPENLCITLLKSTAPYSPLKSSTLLPYFAACHRSKVVGGCRVLQLQLFEASAKSLITVSAIRVLPTVWGFRIASGAKASLLLSYDYALLLFLLILLSSDYCHIGISSTMTDNAVLSYDQLYCNFARKCAQEPRRAGVLPVFIVSL